MAKSELVKVTTPVFRVSFPSVFEASSFNGGAAKYSVVMLFNKAAQETKEFAAMRAILKDAALKKFGGKIPGNLKNAFRKGEEKAELEGYGPGVIFATASSKHRPGIVDARRNPILTPEEFYAGCWARATVTAYGYDQKGNKGVAFGLHNLQKVRDDESFSGRAKAEDDFGEVAEDEWSDGASAQSDDDFLGGGSSKKDDEIPF